MTTLLQEAEGALENYRKSMKSVRHRLVVIRRLPIELQEFDGADSLSMFLDGDKLSVSLTFWTWLSNTDTEERATEAVAALMKMGFVFGKFEQVWSNSENFKRKGELTVGTGKRTLKVTVTVNGFGTPVGCKVIREEVWEKVTKVKVLCENGEEV